MSDERVGAVQINLRLPPALLDHIDNLRGAVPRNRWIVGYLEAAMSEAGWKPFRGEPGPDVLRLRSSDQAKAGVSPIPKK